MEIIIYGTHSNAAWWEHLTGPFVHLEKYDLLSAIRTSDKKDSCFIRAGTRLPPFWQQRLNNHLNLFDKAAALTPLSDHSAELNPLRENQSLDNSKHQLDQSLWWLGEHSQFLSDFYSPELICLNLQAIELIHSNSDFQLDQLSDWINIWVCQDIFIGSDSQISGCSETDDTENKHLSAPICTVRNTLQPLLNHQFNGYPGLDDKPVVLHISHSWGGGVKQWISDFCHDHSAHHLLLQSSGQWKRQIAGSGLNLIDASSGVILGQWIYQKAIKGIASHSTEYQLILDEIRNKWSWSQTVISSLIGHSLDALHDNQPCLWMVHDFFPLCPAINSYYDQTCSSCNEKRLSKCLADNPLNKHFAQQSAAFWLEIRTQLKLLLLQSHINIVAPSEFAKQQFSMLLNQQGNEPSLNIEVREHPTPAALRGIQTLPNFPPEGKLKLAVLGRMTEEKGAAILAEALPEIKDFCHITLLGCGKEGQKFVGEAGVDLIPQYQIENLAKHLVSTKAQAVLLLSIVPETFSYTLSEAFKLGFPAIATHQGSLAERVIEGKNGWLIEPSAKALVTLIKQLHQNFISPTEINSDTHIDNYLEYTPGLSIAPKATAFLSPAVQQQQLAHAIKINHIKETELIKLRSLVKDQFNDLESRLKWARGMEKLLEERTVWAKSLDQDNQQLQHQLNSEKEMHTQQLEELKTILKLQTENFQAQIVEGQKLRENLEQDLRNKNQELINTRHKLDDTFEQLQKAEHRAQEIENSTFWKLTAPLRWLVIRFKFLFIHPIKRLVRLTGRVLKSLSNRGLGGTIKHIKERRVEPEPVEQPQIEEVDLEEPRQPLVFSQAKHIDASIIIPVHGQSHHTYQCLKSLLETHNHSQFEVIVVDDCSIDDTPEFLASVEGIKTHKNEQNLGFVGSCNQGLKLAEGDFVVYLNNDTTVTKGWLDALINTFTEHKDVGLVGAKLVYPDGSLQEAGGIIFNDGSGWNYGRNENPDDSRFNFVRETDYCSGAAIMARREVLNKLGGFDQRYSPAYYEDTDLAFQMREQGLRVLYQPASIVVHYEGVSCGTDTSSGLKKYQLVNQQKFLERWKQELAQQFSPEQGAELARERLVKGRVLICDAVTPTPDQDSGSVRMVNIMRILKELNYAVSFIPENHARSGKYTRNLQQMGVECLYQPFFKSPLEFFQSRGSDFDLIILSRHYVAEQYIDLIKQFSPRAKILFDTVDLHFLREQRFAELENSDKLRKRAEQTRQQEMKIANACHKTLVVSPIEVEVLAEQAPQLDVAILSNVHEVYGCQNDFSSRRDIMFVGGYQHPPNVDAVLYFVEQIWPTVHAALPELKFRIIGSKMPDEIRQLEGQEGLEVVGFVEQLEPELNQCRLAIAPLRYGAGVKGKVNMSMSYGQPVIATPIAVEGMHAQHEHDVMVADNPEDFAQCIIRAYQNEELWNTLSENALANVEQHFSFNAAKAALEKIIQD